jgi:hypothetical protein
MDIKDGFATFQKSIYGVLFVFMSLMKSPPMVERTEVLRGTPPGIEA